VKSLSVEAVRIAEALVEVVTLSQLLSLMTVTGRVESEMLLGV
jgi:hypothetical protein